MSSSHKRSSSHATPRQTASNSQRPSSQQREHTLSSGSGALHGASPASVPRKRRSDHDVPEDAKRRRQDAGVLSADELLKPSIVVRSHPPNPLSRPCTLFPMMLLPREHLPLSCLDLSSPSGDLPSSRHVQSQIRILDLEGRLGSNILIAWSPSSNSGSSGGFSSASSIFAIERDDNEAGLYVLCKLGSWVDITKLGRHATAVCQQRMPASPSARASAKGEEPALITPQVYKERGRKRLAIAELQSIVKRKPASQAVTDAASASQVDDMPSPLLEMAEDSQPTLDLPIGNDEANDELPTRPQSQLVKPAVLPTPHASDNTKRSSTEPTAPVEPAEPAGPPTAEDIFQNIRNQYFEALYHSLGSLAYFAKGPLSRARAAFHLDCDSNLEMDELIDFLKSIILTSATIDKKYRETVPDLVSHLRTLGEISDHTETKRKSKKPKKVKLGSSGLYTDEDVHVRKWWAANKPAPRDDEVFPRPEEVRYTISCLRTRETQLQMILILEIMALETMRPAGDAGESQLPGMAITPAKKDVPKKRNKHNLPLLIDVHADRLCIWQSTTSDDVRAMAESQARPAGEAETTKTAHSDPLKDFCIDIIVPFFSPRLPLVCDSLNRKLGGPVISASGSRSKPAANSTKSPSDAKSRDKSSSSKHHSRSKPGAATKRSSASTDKTRSLERVLSTERLRRSVSRGPNDAIAQMRSATAAPIPGLKRENSEPALASIPRRASSTSLKDRPSNTLARSSSDVVLPSNSAGRSEESRARKKALVDAELQEAISALKKPNRELAGKATVEAAEKRMFGIQNQKKPRKQQPRPSPGERVQVKATPVNNRFRDVFATTTTTMEFHGHSQAHQEPYRLPVNRELLFPGRSQHQIQMDFLPASPRITSTPSAARIQATPIRTSTSVPDSVAKAAPAATTSVTASTTTTTNTAGTVKVSMARASRLETFPEEEESVPMSSPVAARRVAPQVVSSAGGANLNVFRRLNETRASLLDGDMIPASSPLQARSQPSATVKMQTENREAVLSTSTQRRSALFETPTKVRSVTMEDSAAMKRVMATPLLATPLMSTPRVSRPLTTSTTNNVGGGNSVQSLYAQMGWDDEIDDLA